MGEIQAAAFDGQEPDYIALDLETTGLNPKVERIIEIGAVKVERGQETARFHTMVDPHRKLDPRITELTGITDGMLGGAPDIRDVLPEFLSFSGELPLLGHNVIFDYRFLKRAAVNSGFAFERSGFDTLRLCRRFMPGPEKKDLGSACAFYGIQRGQAHRALGDAEDAHRLFARLFSCYGGSAPDAFLPVPLLFKIKREQPASKKQKEDLQDLLKYHRINLTVQIDDLSRNEIMRLRDKIILQYGRIR